MVEGDRAGGSGEGVRPLRGRVARGPWPVARRSNTICDEGVEAGGAVVDGGVLAVALDRDTEIARVAGEDLDRLLLAVAAEPDHRRHGERLLAKRLDEAARRVELLLRRHTGAGAEVAVDAGLRKQHARRAVHLRGGRVARGVAEVGHREAAALQRVHRHHRAAAAGAVKRHHPLAAREPLAHLHEVEGAAVVVALHLPGDALERCRRVTEVAGDVDPELRVTEHRGVVGGDAAVERHHAPVAGRHQRVDLRGPRLDAASDLPEPNTGGRESLGFRGHNAGAAPEGGERGDVRRRDRIERQLGHRPRVLLRDLLDAAAAAAGDQQHRAAPAVVEDDAGEALAGDLEALLDEHLGDRKPLDGTAEDAGGRLLGSRGVGGEGDQPLPGPAGRPRQPLDHHGAAERACRLARRGSGRGRGAARHGQPGRSQHLFALELGESRHCDPPSGARIGNATEGPLGCQVKSFTAMRGAAARTATRLSRVAEGCATAGDEVEGERAPNRRDRLSCTVGRREPCSVRRCRPGRATSTTLAWW